MIKFEILSVEGFEPAMRGMRNPKNSWKRSDSHKIVDAYVIGDKDISLSTKLSTAGPVHAKHLRMIVAYVDITAPLYWWKEFDTYKVGTVANSCSTMHKIAEKEFEIDDISTDRLADDSKEVMRRLLNLLNYYRQLYLEENDDPDLKKHYWWQMIQMLPSSYNQRRTIMISYEVLANIYTSGRRTHKLDEWRIFCKFIENLPYSEFITARVRYTRKAEESDTDISKNVQPNFEMVASVDESSWKSRLIVLTLQTRMIPMTGGDVYFYDDEAIAIGKVRSAEYATGEGLVIFLVCESLEWKTRIEELIRSRQLKCEVKDNSLHLWRVFGGDIQ